MDKDYYLNTTLIQDMILSSIWKDIDLKLIGITPKTTNRLDDNLILPVNGVTSSIRVFYRIGDNGYISKNTGETTTENYRIFIDINAIFHVLPPLVLFDEVYDFTNATTYDKLFVLIDRICEDIKLNILHYIHTIDISKLYNIINSNIIDEIFNFLEITEPNLLIYKESLGIRLYTTNDRLSPNINIKLDSIYRNSVRLHIEGLAMKTQLIDNKNIKMDIPFDMENYTVCVNNDKLIEISKAVNTFVLKL